MKRIVLMIWGIILFFNSQSKEYSLLSPDKKLNAVISIGEDISYSISFNGISYLLPSSISMTLKDHTILGQNPKIKNVASKSVENILKPQYGISKTIKEKFNELKFDFAGNYSVTFRMYDEGFAWRFSTSLKSEQIIKEEKSEFKFAADYQAYFHPVISESLYRVQKISDYRLKPNYTTLPLLVKTTNGTSILIHESDVLGYPCMSLSTDSLITGQLNGKHAKYPKSTKPGGHMNFNLLVTDTEDYIARVSGTRDFPWRMLVFEENDKDILNNQLVYLLASENKLENTAWIQPGKVVWDWWNALNAYGVDFETGFNTETYKYMIDFAAANGIEYVNLDEGWSDQFDLMAVTDKLEMKELVEYANSKNVGLILWCVWYVLDRQMTEALQQFKEWGIRGIKVDFMDRDDQIVVEFHERLLKEAAKNQLIVNYHGAFHPTGMQRTYPNNLNVEGVRGLEYNKFNEEGTPPGHDVSIPFIRMFAGSMDYTPGAMNNYNKEDWRMIPDRPMSQGTRCHQLAMFIVYFAPLQMLADAPTLYEKEPEILEFISDVPTIWDETVPLQGKVGETVCIARKKDTDWYVGAMTNWDSRTYDISLDFLDEEKVYEAVIFMDGINANRVGNDYKKETIVVRKGDKIAAQMANGGGIAIKISER